MTDSSLEDMNRMLNAELAERILTEQRLRASEESLRALAGHLQSVREEERIRIAREIHDELGQALTGLKFDLKSFTTGFAKETPDARAQGAQALSASIDRIIGSVRRIASGLRPEVLDEIGLAAALEWQAREFQRRTGVRCMVGIASSFSDPDKGRSTALFRIFQELLTNVARHANATRVKVSISHSKGAIHLVVDDNGRGIPQAMVQSPRSLGVMGLRERVQAFGGKIEFKGTEGRGTTVSVSIPTVIIPMEFHA